MLGDGYIIYFLYTFSIWLDFQLEKRSQIEEEDLASDKKKKVFLVTILVSSNS